MADGVSLGGRTEEKTRRKVCSDGFIFRALQSRVYPSSLRGTAVFLADQEAEVGSGHGAFGVVRARLYPSVLRVATVFVHIRFASTLVEPL